MNPSDISLKDIQYILAIARFKSFSQAAESCAVSQPALSKQVKLIETSLGTQLFERTKRQVLVTESGARFLQQAQTVMDAAEKLIRVTLGEQVPLSGTFKLGVIASSCPYLLPYFVGGLKETYPQLKLIINEGLTDPLIQELKQGNLDAVIAATTFEDEAVLHTPLFFEPFLLAVRKQNVGSTNKENSKTLKAKPSKLSDQKNIKQKIEVSDIDTDSLLLLEDGHCLKDQTMELCAIKESKASLSFKATSLETLLQMTVGGLGVSVIPVLAVSETSKLSEALVFSEFKDRKIGRTMALYYRKSYSLTHDIEALADCIKLHLPSFLQSQA